MTGIDGATTARLQDPPEPSDWPLPDVFATFNAEFFVEWQVADDGPLACPSSQQASSNQEK